MHVFWSICLGETIKEDLYMFLIDEKPAYANIPRAFVLLCVCRWQTPVL